MGIENHNDVHKNQEQNIKKNEIKTEDQEQVEKKVKNNEERLSKIESSLQPKGKI